MGLSGSNGYSFGQLIVDAVPRVLDGHDTVVLFAGHYGDRLSAVTAEREEKSVKLLVVCCY